MKKIGFVIGTGRCATKSFTYLLNEQDRVKAEHEVIPCKWSNGGNCVKRNINHLNGIVENEDVDLAIAVGFYFLPYIEEIILKYNIKCVCLKRKKEDTVASYIRKFRDRNYFRFGNNHKWTQWNGCYPKFDYTIEIEDAVNLYYDNYYSIADFLESKYPNNFVVCHIPTVLYDKDYQKQILEFIGIKNPIIQTKIKLNALIQKLRKIRFEPSSLAACKCNKVYI